MNIQNQQEKAAKTTVINEFITTKAGTIIIGSELIGSKMTAIVCEMMAVYSDSNPVALVFRNDDYPSEAFGMTYADSFSIVINLQRCWDHSVEVAMSEEKNLGLSGLVWVNLLSSVAHELDHLDFAFGDRELYEQMRATEDGNKDLETAASDNEEKMIAQMARDFDIEIPPVAELGWFGTQIMGLFTADDTKDLDWVVKARKMLEDNVIYAEKENDISITSFREFVKQAYEQTGPGWEQSVSAVNLVAHLENGETEILKADPAPLPMVVEAEKIEETVEMVAQPGGMFVGAGTTVGSDAPDIVAVQPEELTTENLIANNTPVGSAAQVAAAATGTPVADNLAIPLPPPVAAQAQAFATAAATAAPPASPTTYPPCAMNEAQMPAMMEQIYKTLYHHLFTKCGWSQNPQSGRFYFAQAAAVLEGVNIQHIIQQFGADNFIMEYDTLNASGQPAAEACQGMIRGYTTSKQGLPAYAIFLNIGGRRIKRSILPQNPEKRNAQNAYTNSANDAGAGHQIAWVFKDEVADSAPFNEKCAVKITNTAQGINYEVIS